MHNEELHNLYSSTDIISMNNSCSMQGEKTNTYRILVENTEGRRPLGRPRRRPENKHKMDLKKDRMGWCGLD
jgi:hypothetical protein